MKVPQYQESQRLGNAPDARFSVNGRALSLALGGETWGSVDRAGRQMRATGEQMGGIALDLMREHNETVAMDRLNKAEAAILDMQAEQALRKGRDALGDAVASGSELIAQAVGGSGLAGPYGAAAGAGKDGKSVGVTGTLRAGLDKLRGELTQGMNPAQKKLFDNAFTPRGRSVLRWGASFEAQQREVFTTSTEDGLKAVQGQRILARYQDPEQVSSALGNIQYVEERRGKRLGLAPEAVEANVALAMQKALLPMFDAMMDKGELGQARNALKLFGPDLGAGTAAAVQAKIRARADALRAKAEANRAREARTLLKEEKDALYRAKYMGDVSALTRLADGLRSLGFTDEAEEMRAGADFWTAHREAGTFAAKSALPDVAARMRELSDGLDGDVSGMSVEEHERLSGQLKAMSDIYTERVKAYRDDPARAAQASLVLPDDATPEDTARLRLEAQAADGVPPDGRAPLAKAEAGQLAARWSELPAEQRPAFLRELQQFGPYAPQVMRQVGISALDQDLAFAMLNEPAAVGGAKRVFSVMALKEDELPKMDVKADLADVLEECDAYQAYLAQAKATNSRDVWSAAKTYERAAERLLKTGSTPDEVRTVLNAGRAMLHDGNVAALVPAARADAVQGGLNRMLEERLPEFVRQSLAGKPAYAINEELRRIRRAGVFINSPDGSGFTLLDGVTGLPYRDGRGEAFALSLEDAEDLAGSAGARGMRWMVNGLTGVSE